MFWIALFCATSRSPLYLSPCTMSAILLIIYEGSSSSFILWTLNLSAFSCVIYWFELGASLINSLTASSSLWASTFNAGTTYILPVDTASPILDTFACVSDIIACIWSSTDFWAVAVFTTSSTLFFNWLATCVLSLLSLFSSCARTVGSESRGSPYFLS